MRASLDRRRAAPARLKLVGSGGLCLTLEVGGERLFGRTTGDLLVDDPSVSGTHCRVFRLPEGVFIEDLHSTNGTFLDDEPVESVTPWTPGAVLRLGTHQLVLEVDGADAIHPDDDDEDVVDPPTFVDDDGERTQVLQVGAMGIRHQLEMMRLKIQVEELRRSMVESGGRMTELSQGLQAAQSDRKRLRLAAQRLELTNAVERLLNAEHDSQRLLARLLATLVDNPNIDLEPRAMVYLDDGSGRLSVASSYGPDPGRAFLPAVSSALGQGPATPLPRGAVVVPIRSAHGSVGAFLLFPKNELDNQWLDTLHTMGEQVSVALQHLHFLDALKEARDQALAASRTKSRFLETMSHELRTPLNAILGYAQLLLEVAHEEGRTHDIADLERIDRSARHLLAMIAGILDLTAIEGGSRELRFATFDASELVREVVDSVRLDAERQQNRIILDLPRPVPLRSDHELVHRLVYNLLTNANKFTDRGEIRVSVAARGQAVSLQVRDTGIGIPPERIESIFEPFTQVDDSTTRVYGGTGIGLAVVKQFTETLGGRVSVASIPGRGSVFTVTLPVR